MKFVIEPLQQAAHSAVQNVTPTRLKLVLVINGLIILLFSFASITTVEEHGQAVRTIGIDSAPSVIAAHQIKIGLEAMDADLARELLYPPGTAETIEIEKDFNQWRASVGKELVAAAKNITYGSAEQQPIEAIQVGVCDYLMQSQAVRDLHKSGQGATALDAYRAALDTLKTKLLPATDGLDRANSDVLETIYKREKSATNLCRGAVFVTGTFVLLMFLYTQIFLAVRFRRRFSLPMILAMAAISLVLHQLTVALSDNSQWLKIAKEDAYDSIFALFDAKADAYEANAAQVRWLLEPKMRTESQQEFDRSVSAMVNFDQNHNFQETLERAQKQLQTHERFNLPGFSGSLADELNNLRFSGEPEAAVDTLQAFGDFASTQKKIQDAELSGDHDGALHLCLGYRPGQSRYAFDHLNNALSRTLQINQEQMDEALQQALTDLVGLVAAVQIVCAFAAVCVALSVLPRIDEYVRCGPKSK